jgi:hypothetical protein
MKNAASTLPSSRILPGRSYCLNYASEAIWLNPSGDCLIGPWILLIESGIKRNDGKDFDH